MFSVITMAKPAELASLMQKKYDLYSKEGGGPISMVNSWDLTDEVNDIIKQIHPEVKTRYYGSGLMVPDILDGLNVIDVGCGSGSLVFVLSKLVGPRGRVVGVDISPVQIDLCEKNAEYHQKLWEYKEPNTEFYVEDTQDLSRFADQSFDVVVSNGGVLCAPDILKALKECYRILKDGGEFGLSDWFSETPPPKHLQSQLEALPETVDSFTKASRKAGFTTPYLVGASGIRKSKKVEKVLGGMRYCALIYRMFRLPPTCELKNQPSFVTYTGPKKCLKWDVNLLFKRGKGQHVDGDLADIIRNTDYKTVFQMEDATNIQVKNKTEDPFEYIDRLKESGQNVPDICTIDAY